MEKFFNSSFYIDKDIMKYRINNLCASYNWQFLVYNVLKRYNSFKGIKIAEVGCGTGTFSLAMDLLGAETTLIDADEDALNIAERVFNMYDRKPHLVMADVLDPVPQHLCKQYHIAFSGGLAEHFIGEDRLKCIDFHKALIRDDGFVAIQVPNRLSIGYQAVRVLRSITGTWALSIEKPFTYWELKDFSNRVGFKNCNIVGNFKLTTDTVVYSKGIISAVLDILPKQVRKTVHTVRSKTKVSDSGNNAYNENMEQQNMLVNRVKYIEDNVSFNDRNYLKDYFSAGITLFGFGD